MEVLFISPKDPKVPTKLKYLVGGENTYTDSLLSAPPSKVNYTHHFTALKKGEIEYTLWQPFFNLLIKLRILPLDAGFFCIKLNKKYDLIHCHVYNLKLDGKIRPPVVLGDSSCNIIFLRHYLHWSEARISFHYFLRKTINDLFGLYDQIWTRYRAKNLIVMSDFAKKIHTNLYPKGKITVIPPGLTDKGYLPKKSPEKVNILFAGIWFERKGGLVLLNAFNKLQKKCPNANLILLGPVPKKIKLPANTIQKDFVPYKQLVSDYYPSADIFVLVPPEIEGYGLVVDEAMSFGLPVVASDICALPERVIDGKTGFLVPPSDSKALADKLEILIKDKGLRELYGRNAKQLFLEKFSITPTRKQLLEVYQQAVQNNK